MHRFPDLAWFLCDELLWIVDAKADGSYWKQDNEQGAPEYREQRGNFFVGGGD